MISNIHSTTIAVADQQAALDFYINVLGWEKAIDQQMGPDMRFLTVVPKGAVTQLVLAHESWYGMSEPGMAPVAPNRVTMISLTVSDIEATYESLKEQGVKFKGPLEQMPWGAKATWMYDLDDNGFFFVEEMNS